MPRRNCIPLVRGLPGFPAIVPAGGNAASAVLANRLLQVATGYSPGTPLQNYQFTDIQVAIDYANTNLSPTRSNPVTIQIYPGTYQQNLTLYDNIHLVGFDGTIIVGTITYNNASANSEISLTNLIFDDVGDPSARNDFKIVNPGVEIHHDNVRFMTNIFFYCWDGDGTSVDDYIFMTNSTYWHVIFDNVSAKPTPTDRTALISNCLFNGSLTVGFTADQYNVTVVDAIGCTFDGAIQVGNAIVPNILRANSCTFKSAIVTLLHGFVNLMNSTVDPSSVSGPGTVDMNIISIPSIELTPAGVPLTFLTDFGFSVNTSLGYQVVITPLGGTPVMTAADSLTITGFTAYASATADCSVSVVRLVSPI